jgi:hypothetical protein
MNDDDDIGKKDLRARGKIRDRREQKRSGDHARIGLAALAGSFTLGTQ